MDTEKTGFVKYEVFFELLHLHKVQLSSKATSYIKNNFSRNQTINFKEAINQLTIDLDAAAGSEMVWTVFALAKATSGSRAGDDSVSMVGSVVSRKTTTMSVKSGNSYLSKDKLAAMNIDY